MPQGARDHMCFCLPGKVGVLLACLEKEPSTPSARCWLNASLCWQAVGSIPFASPRGVDSHSLLCECFSSLIHIFFRVQVGLLVPLADCSALKGVVTAPGETLTRIGWLELFSRLVYKLLWNQGNTRLHLHAWAITAHQLMVFTEGFCPAQCSPAVPKPWASPGTWTKEMSQGLGQGTQGGWGMGVDPRLGNHVQGFGRSIGKISRPQSPLPALEVRGEVGAFVCRPKMATGKGKREKCGWTHFGKWHHWEGRWGKRGVWWFGKGQGALQGDAFVS